MLEFFGGVPEILVPDNLKSGVNKACRYDPELIPSYQQQAEHYQVAVIPARPRKPRDKPKVEVGVQIVERWILARLRHQARRTEPLYPHAGYRAKRTALQKTTG